MNKRHHITVKADRRTGEWLDGTIEYAGLVDLHEHMRRTDSSGSFHTMHYLTRDIVEKIFHDTGMDLKNEIDVTVTITRAGKN